MIPADICLAQATKKDPESSGDDSGSFFRMAEILPAPDGAERIIC